MSRICYDPFSLKNEEDTVSFRTLIGIGSLFINLLYGEATAAMTSEQTPVVVFETTEGTFEVTLNPTVAPKTCENFLGLVKKHYYDGTIFHRVIKNFMIQGGDPSGTGMGGPGYEIKDEFSPGLKHNKIG